MQPGTCTIELTGRDESPHMHSMEMIFHALRLFFATGFVSAAALQAYVSSANWLGARGVSVITPQLVTHAGPALALCSAAAAVVTLFSGVRRASRQAHARQAAR